MKEYKVKVFDNRVEWRFEGQLHRENGPAIKYSNGTKYWYKEGKLHRKDGPAIEDSNGSKYWYKEGKIHRIDGPAIEDSNGDKLWYKEGKKHRIDGPAIEYSNGYKIWYQEGKQIMEEEFKADFVKTVKFKKSGFVNNDNMWVSIKSLTFGTFIISKESDHFSITIFRNNSEESYVIHSSKKALKKLEGN